ncbi:hypothetical protein [Hymenobacter sp. GOD-10R]|uniref:hypothetical protein n=1 Tax=Hymenobacter sp. GOD-10R TaxID=3093922 RepID=UPI002D78A4D0|nr:hypothetical protein [Hymenobacter sp. GOD-10R]WRQ29197.1 hypothetical protein SD425_02835 [Hymenobacter sp. GOD-10R]
MFLRSLLQSPTIEISFDHRNDWLYAEWVGDQDFDSVKQGCLQMLDFMKAERCHKVLNDNRLVTSMWSDAAEWGGHVWFPAMKDAGLEYFAWVYSPNVFSRLSTDLTLQHTTQPVVLTFDNVETAKAWLVQM